MAHGPVAEPALGDLLVGQQPDILVPVVPHDGVENLADFVPAALEDLDEQVIRHAEQTRYALSRVVTATLVEDRIKQGAAQGLGGAACIEAANEHAVQFLCLIRERNSERRV